MIPPTHPSPSRGEGEGGGNVNLIAGPEPNMVQGRQAQYAFCTNFPSNLVRRKNLQKDDYCKKVGIIV